MTNKVSNLYYYLASVIIPCPPLLIYPYQQQPTQTHLSIICLNVCQTLGHIQDNTYTASNMNMSKIEIKSTYIMAILTMVITPNSSNVHLSNITINICHPVKKENNSNIPISHLVTTNIMSHSFDIHNSYLRHTYQVLNIDTIKYSL